MKKWLLLITILTTTFANIAQAKEWKTIRFGIEGAYPPFSKTEADGSLSGFDIDIAKAICHQMQAKCTIVPQDWDSIIPSLLAHKYDAIMAAMDITKERLKRVDFTNKYAQTPNRFLVKKGTKLDFKHLDGVKIGVQRATTHDQYLIDNYKNVDIVRYNSFDDACLDLDNGRVAAILGDGLVIEDKLKEAGASKAYELAGPSLTDPKWFGEGLGIATRKQDKDLTAQFNAAIKAIRADGTYKKIQDKYFDFDIYGD
ncbi:lysine/arginine/ornithine ABC transporter substrate-binding protein [Vibrio rarus]|uniref:lysine/arginine/ornithine ABC transporter substrate-binding protein n=1 Tax=Vibrio rarus TaxID=413403 RepID=UPI0021C38F5E|nr:lysine/arginine/ornithine ABC transporter substrate-binding protein [Vibrio rarus]